jgi:exopolysaccharide biosynthesis polyprenyl glycosylphosphotransferase
MWSTWFPEIFLNTNEGCERRMATSEFWQRVSSPVSVSQELVDSSTEDTARGSQGKVYFWMLMDVATIVASVTIAILYKKNAGLVADARGLWHGTLIHGRSMGTLLALLCFFAAALIITSRRLNLYSPKKLTSILLEQRLSIQACLTSGLLLAGLLYIVKAEDISRAIVLLTIGLVTAGLSLRRLIYRLMLYRSFDRGVGTRNVFIVGTGPEGRALRQHLESIRHLGYTFKGFIELPYSGSPATAAPGDVVGTMDSLFQLARKYFVDEIFFTTPCERRVVQGMLEQARVHGVDLRIVPEMYDGHTWNNPVEYVGQFPTIPLHHSDVPEMAMLLKRTVDIVFSTLVLILFSPMMLAIAIAIKLDSRGPVFYLSKRIGKKGRAFRCIKFRTMVHDADKQRGGLMHRNERRSVLFKISDDPRITRLGHFLRKYSLDEVPQFFNVLRGDMSVVGPRPPIGSEVREYQLNHLRRLDVIPGITGLWQVQARQDPSFDSYISLDVAYIENWSIWLDLHIILRTIGVVLAGTGR